METGRRSGKFILKGWGQTKSLGVIEISEGQFAKVPKYPGGSDGAFTNIVMSAPGDWAREPEFWASEGQLQTWFSKLCPPASCWDNLGSS